MILEDQISWREPFRHTRSRAVRTLRDHPDYQWSRHVRLSIIAFILSVAAFGVFLLAFPSMRTPQILWMSAVGAVSVSAFPLMIILVCGALLFIPGKVVLRRRGIGYYCGELAPLANLRSIDLEQRDEGLTLVVLTRRGHLRLRHEAGVPDSVDRRSLEALVDDLRQHAEENRRREDARATSSLPLP